MIALMALVLAVVKRHASAVLLIQRLANGSTPTIERACVTIIYLESI